MIAMPGKIAWLMASLINATPRSTKKMPGNTQATATKQAIIRISN
jgi:hypothetical protein